MELWLVFILFSAILLAAWVLMLRRDVMHEPNTQVFSVYPLAMIVLLPILSYVTSEKIDYSLALTHDGLLILIKTAAIAISLFCTSLALKRLPLSVVGPLRNLNPFFVALLGFFLLNESLSTLNIVGLIVLVAGVVLLDVDLRKSRNIQSFVTNIKKPGSLLLLIAAFIISFSPILDRILLDRGVGMFTILFYFSVFLTIIYWTTHIIMNRSNPLKGLHTHEVLWLLLTGVTLMFADILYYLALSFPGVFVAVVVGVRRTSNLFVTLFGGAILHEDQLLYKTAMCALMIFGTILLIL